MGDTVALMNVRWKRGPFRIAELSQEERPERQKVRRHTEPERATPFPSGLSTKQHASPESVCQNVHLMKKYSC
jgi:hypothetical protein